MRIPAWVALGLLLLLTALIARWPRREPNLTSVRALLDGAMAPWIAGLACALGVGYVWGSLDPVPIYHDEAAYLLQARLFAHGVVAGAPAPLREFFEQFHVFVSPVLAPKYPPGFALAMVPGIWLGAPALIPITLAGITGGLLFQLSRRDRWWAGCSAGNGHLDARPRESLPARQLLLSNPNLGTLAHRVVGPAQLA